MQIQPGTFLAHYEVVAPLGKGAIGEVYRAKDTKLGRDVAIKILPEEFTKDASRLARFDREARVLASLDHPHVASIHGFEEVDGVRFLVMQLANGEDLSDRIRRGPIPVDETIEIARQIAEGLEAAHEQGIVHRDLKPANIKIDDEGNVTVLDFGLAKALETEETDINYSNSPTMTRASTHAGVILGTAAYMSPEQARGKRVDKRADIWSFGVVLWEMLTGRCLFAGDTVSDTLASVLKEEPDWGAIPDGATQSLRSVLRRCLVKNPKERMRDIGDARLELVEPDLPAGDEAAPTTMGPSIVPWIVTSAAVIIAVLAVASTWKGDSSEAASVPLHLRVPLEPADRLVEDSSVAISPDGMTIIFRGLVDGRVHLLARNLTTSEVTIIPGSEDPGRPSFSPDGTSIAFGAGTRIWKTSLSGGDPAPTYKKGIRKGHCLFLAIPRIFP